MASEFPEVEKSEVELYAKEKFSKEKYREVMDLAKEFLNQPEIRKDILMQMKQKISGKPA